jgi:hypothetical protein
VVAGLSGCSSLWDSRDDGRADDILTSDVDPQSVPDFLSDPPGPDDALPAAASSALSAGIDPASVRYQGVWHGIGIYLAVAGVSEVELVQVPEDAPSEVSWGSTTGNSPIGAARDDHPEVELVYLPQGTGDLPSGWTAFSDWIATRG